MALQKGRYFLVQTFSLSQETVKDTGHCSSNCIPGETSLVYLENMARVKIQMTGGTGKKMAVRTGGKGKVVTPTPQKRIGSPSPSSSTSSSSSRAGSPEGGNRSRSSSGAASAKKRHKRAAEDVKVGRGWTGRATCRYFSFMEEKKCVISLR